MRILMHKDIYEDLELLSEMCDFIFKGSKIDNLTFVYDFNMMRFDLDYQKQRQYNSEVYVELEENLLEEYIYNNSMMYEE